MQFTSLIIAAAAFTTTLVYGKPVRSAELVARDNYNACLGECNAQGGDCYTHTAAAIMAMDFSIPDDFNTMTWYVTIAVAVEQVLLGWEVLTLGSTQVVMFCDALCTLKYPPGVSS